MSQRMSQKESKTFLYKKVYQDLKDRIQNGEYLRDALLPSEREIGETYQVDRTTVRKALQLLVDDGLVEKRAGKGTVVVLSLIHICFPAFTGNYAGLQISSRSAFAIS